MDINIGESILEFLHDNDGAYIPDLGVFSFVNSPSSFTLEDNVLTPPTKRLSFTDSLGSDKFAHFLSDKYSIAKSTANLVLSKFAQKANNSILNFGSSSINGIGEISKSATGTSFEPVISNFHKSYLFLNPITLKPVSPIKSTTTQPTTTQSTRDSLDDAKGESSIPLETTAPIAAVAGAATLSATTDSTKSQQSSVSSPETVNQGTEPQKKSLKQSLNEAYKEQITKSATATSEQTAYPIYEEPEKSLFSKLLWPLLVLALILLSVFSCMRYCGDGNNIKDALSKNSSVVGENLKDAKDGITGISTDTSTDTSNGAGMSEELLNNPNYIKYKDVLTPENLSTGCIVIVGSFTKSRNVVRMKDRIIRAGYDPYTEVYGKFTRVGTLFNCLDHDLKDHLQTFRSDFNSRAWYLEPDLEVPYN